MYKRGSIWLYSTEIVEGRYNRALYSINEMGKRPPLWKSDMVFDGIRH